MVALEKLILRGVLWGADRIPDSVFDKIPGGYYKAKEQQEKVERKLHDDDMPKRRSHRRHSEDDQDHRRRHTRDEREDGYTSDGHKRRSNAKRYDGGNNAYDSVNDRPRRRRSRVDHNRSVNHATQDNRKEDASLTGGFSYHNGPVEPPLMSPHQAATGAAYGSPPSTQYGSPIPQQGMPQSMPQSGQQISRSTSTLRGGMATGYVPYADIYGGPAQEQQHSNPGYAATENGSVQPTYTSQVAPSTPRDTHPVQPQPGYNQNPFAQEAPIGSQPGYLPDPYYSARHYDDRYHVGREQSSPGYSRSPSHDRSSRQDGYSSVEDGDGARDDRRRSRSERRKDHPQARGKSLMREKFDTSQKGLSYSAIGAVTGGIVGKQMGKGPLTSAIGAVIGAAGANAFQARERKKEDARHV